MPSAFRIVKIATQIIILYILLNFPYVLTITLLLPFFFFFFPTEMVIFWKLFQAGKRSCSE